MKNYIQKLLILLISFIFTSCGGGEEVDSGTTTTLKFISGKIIDGYIKEAEVCLDLNTNGICEDDEPRTYSLNDGSYSFTTNLNNSTNVIAIISKGGIDISTNKPYLGELKNIVEITSTSENINATLNTFSDLQASDYISKKDLTSSNSLKNKITTVFSISNLQSDAMQDKHVFIKAQVLEHIKSILEVSILKVKSTSLSDEEKRVLRNNIKYSIIKNILSTTNYTLDVNNIITTLENDLSITIPQNEKTFIINQVSKTKSILQNITLSNSILISQLSTIQLELYNGLQNVYTKLNSASSDTVLEVDTLMNLRKEISKNLLDLSFPKDKSYETPPLLPSLD